MKQLNTSMTRFYRRRNCLCGNVVNVGVVISHKDGTLEAKDLQIGFRRASEKLEEVKRQVEKVLTRWVTENDSITQVETVGQDVEKIMVKRVGAEFSLGDGSTLDTSPVVVCGMDCKRAATLAVCQEINKLSDKGITVESVEIWE